MFDEHWILSRLSAILELKTGNFEAEEGSFYVIDLQFYVIEQMIAIEIGIFIHPSRIYYQYKRGQWISSGDCKQSKEPPSLNYISYEQVKTWDLKHYTVWTDRLVRAGKNVWSSIGDGLFL